MEGISTKAITHRQFLKMCGLAVLGAGASQMVVPPKPVSALQTINDDLYVTGSIGIGVAASGARLHIQAAAADNTVIKLVHPDGWTAFTVGKTGGIMTQGTLQMYGNDDIILDSGTNMLIHNGGNKIGIQTSGNGNAILYDRMLIPSGSDTANIAFLNSNVGIGTTSPLTRLQVGDGSGTTEMRIYGVQSRYMRIFTDGDGNIDVPVGQLLVVTHDNDIALLSGNDIRIAAAPGKSTQFTQGNVGIGTTSPGNKVTVATTAYNDGVFITGSSLQNVALYTNLGQGSFNGITQAGDRGIIYSGASIDNPGGGFVIAPWRSGWSGLRLDANGNLDLAGEFRVNGVLAIKSDGVAAQSYYAQ